MAWNFEWKLRSTQNKHTNKRWTRIIPPSSRMIPTVDPLWNPAKSFDGRTPSGQVEGLPGSILDKFWQEKFLGSQKSQKNPRLCVADGRWDGGWVLVGVGYFNVFLVGCCFCFFFKARICDFEWSDLMSKFILFYLRSKMLQAEISIEGLWFWNIFWICQMLLSWSCGIRNGPPSSGKWRCF